MTNAKPDCPGDLNRHLTWDEYFVLIALCTSLRSKDPRSKVGAVIVNAEKHIVGTGYNGFVQGVDESLFNWKREGDWLETKYPYVVHAEQNAILNATTSDLSLCCIYTTLLPCHECAKMIAQKKIAEVVYVSDKYKTLDSYKATTKILKASNVNLRQHPIPPFESMTQKVRDMLFANSNG